MCSPSLLLIKSSFLVVLTWLTPLVIASTPHFTGAEPDVQSICLRKHLQEDLHEALALHCAGAQQSKASCFPSSIPIQYIVVGWSTSLQVNPSFLLLKAPFLLIPLPFESRSFAADPCSSCWRQQICWHQAGKRLGVAAEPPKNWGKSGASRLWPCVTWVFRTLVGWWLEGTILPYYPMVIGDCDNPSCRGIPF